MEKGRISPSTATQTKKTKQKQSTPEEHDDLKLSAKGYFGQKHLSEERQQGRCYYCLMPALLADWARKQTPGMAGDLTSLYTSNS